MKVWSQRLLGSVSSYRLVSIALTTLLLITFILSIFGIVAQSPVAVIVSSLIFTSVIMLSNYLFAKLFITHSRHESSYITALILFFIFTPTTTATGLVVFGIIGLLAVASKYLLTIHNRHIFNPAAVAATIIGFTGLAGASWWVATPPLFVPTLLLALLILHKTRQLGMAVFFLAIAGASIVTLLIVDGSSLGQALRLLMSWPLLFFAGFMLSEPLTLPPRRWQRFTEAGVVAVLFTAPIQIGLFSTNPALALVAGNILAYVFSRRRAISLTFTSRQQLTPTATEYTFSADTSLQFTPGQYIEMTVPHKHPDSRGTRRMFSLTSLPGSSAVQIGIKSNQHGASSFKAALAKLESGARIQATGTYGDFVLPSDSTRPLLFIAGGIGITPFISHLIYIEEHQQKRDIILLYRVNTIEEIAYSDILQRVGIRVFILSNTGAISAVHGWQILHTRDITEEIVKKAIPDIRTRNVYVSGPPAMVDVTKEQLRSLSIKNIKTDHFDGY